MKKWPLLELTIVYNRVGEREDTENQKIIHIDSAAPSCPLAVHDEIPLFVRPLESSSSRLSLSCLNPDS